MLKIGNLSEERKEEEKMKKKLLLLVAAFALFVPSVLAAEPNYDESVKAFFANGTPVTVEARTDGQDGALIKWDGGEKAVPADTSVFGGSHESDEKLESTNVTVNGGSLHNVFGGGLHKSSVGNSLVIINGGKFTGFIQGGGASSYTATCGHTQYAGDKDGATTVVDNAIVVINGGEIAKDVFGGGEGISYTKKASVIVAKSFTGNIRYLTLGGSNGYTDDATALLLGGKIKVLQSVNRGFMETAEITVNGAEIENAYASAEGDNQKLGVNKKAVINIISGKVKNVAPGQRGTSNENAADISEISYVEGTVVNEPTNFNEEKVTVNINLTLKSDEFADTIQIPKGTTFTDDELQKIIDEINNELKEDKMKFEGFFKDKELKNKFDFSEEINADTTIYLKLVEIKAETPNKEKNPQTSDMNLALILTTLGLASVGAVLVSRKKLAKANR
jgi:predicted phosphodiesterase